MRRDKAILCGCFGSFVGGWLSLFEFFVLSLIVSRYICRGCSSTKGISWFSLGAFTMRTVITLVSTLTFFIGAAARAALQPRQSAASVSPYTPAYFCPNGTGTLVEADWQSLDATDTSQGYVQCSASARGDGPCFYNMDTGLLSTFWGEGSNCAPKAIKASDTPCGVRCAPYGPTGAGLVEVDYDVTSYVESIMCYYSDYTNCCYSFTDDDNLDPTQSSPGCSSTALTTCPNARRSYKREDNFTALLRKRGIPARVPSKPRAS